MYALVQKNSQHTSVAPGRHPGINASGHVYLQKKAKNTSDTLVQLWRSLSSGGASAHHTTASGTQGVQAKLTLGKDDDRFEQEAEATADKVVSQSPTNSRSAQSDENIGIQRRSENGNTVSDDVPQRMATSLRANTHSGVPLEKDVKASMAPYFDGNLDQVRIHTDATAVQMNRAISAQAFTYRNHIYFDSGRYNPASRDGKHLLAHELTHVMQQQGVGTAVRPKTGPKIQRLPASVRELLQEAAEYIPGWHLMTFILGYNPLLGSDVPRSPRALLKGILGMGSVVGNQLFQILENNGLIDAATRYVQRAIAQKDISISRVERLLTAAKEEIGWEVYNAPAVIKRTFGPLYTDIISLGNGAVTRLQSLVKDKVLLELSHFASTLPGFKLLTLVLEKNPVTRKKVARTAVAFVGAVMELVPGGKQKFSDLKKSGGLRRAFGWLEIKIAKLGVSAGELIGLFQKAWQSLTLTDFLIPILAIKKGASVFRETGKRVLRFASDVFLKLLTFTFEGLLGPTAARVLAILKRGRRTYRAIVSNPVRFAQNLLLAVKQGFSRFNENIGTHLKNGLVGWILGALTNAGIQLPKKFDLKGVISLTTQILGITWANIRKKLVDKLGEKTVSRLERTVEIVKLLVARGPMAIWEKLTEYLENLKTTVLDGIKDWVVSKIIQTAVVKVLSMLNPVGAVVQAVLAIYNTIMFFVERMNQIMTLVKSIIGSISLIAAGKLKTAAAFVEKSMANAVPVIISFMARLIGLGGISKTIGKIIKKLQFKVDKAIDKAVIWLVRKVEGLVSKGKETITKVVSWWKLKTQFKAKNGEEHTIFFKGTGGASTLMIASEEKTFAYFIRRIDVSGNPKLAGPKGKAEKIAERIDELKAQKLSGTTKKAKKKEKKEKAEKIEEKLVELRKYTVPLFGIVPVSAEPVYSKRTPFADKTTISRLTVLPPKKGGTGTKPVTTPHTEYDILDARRKGEKGSNYYIRGHLLNHHLHGKGLWNNMTPLSLSGNSQHEKDVESKVKKAVYSGMTLQYSVIANYDREIDKKKLFKEIKDNDGEASEEAKIKRNIVEHESMVPKSLICEASTLEGAQQKWKLGPTKVDNPVEHTYESYQLGDSPIPVTVKINECDEAVLLHLPGVGKELANRIMKYRALQKKNGKNQAFNKLDDLTKVTGIGPDVVKRIRKKGNFDLP